MTRIRSLDLWALLAVTLGAATLAVLDGPMALRLPLGFVAVLLAPGHALVALMFPRAAAFDVAERFALGFAASLALIPLLGLLLTWSLLGISQQTAAGSVAALTTALTAGALWRARSVADEDAPVRQFRQEFRSWLRESPGQAVAVVVVLLTIAAALTLTVQVVRVPNATEFYALGPDRLAHNYPREAVVGQPVAVDLTVVNRERRTMSYRVEVRDGSEVLAVQDAGRLADGASVEIPLSFTPRNAADPRAFDVLLFADGSQQPHRSLRMLVRVRTPEEAAQAVGDG